jgi:hypothetical protein
MCEDTMGDAELFQFQADGWFFGGHDLPGIIGIKFVRLQA